MMETALMPLPSKILWSSSRVGLVTRENVGVNLHQCCGSCSIIPMWIFDTAASECTIRRMKKEQARPCMCGRTKQTMRFLHETPNKTRIACSLEPSMNMQQSPFYLTETREKGHRQRMRPMRLSTQMSVNEETQHQAQSAILWMS